MPFATVAALTLIGWGQQAPPAVRFYDRKRTVESENSRRIVPNPKWITTTWDPKADKQFTELALAAWPLIDAPKAPKSTIDWKKKALTTYEAWFQDSQNPLLIYQVSTYLMIVRELDPTTGYSERFKSMYSTVGRGWEYLENPPKSFLFVRRGYAFNVGDEDQHDYKGIAKLLLQKNPKDRSAAVGLMLEYTENPERPQATLTFQTAESFRESGTWRAWDSRILGRCYQLRSWETKKRSDLVRAIDLGEEAIRNTPKGVATGFITTWVKFMRERELPKLTNP